MIKLITCSCLIFHVTVTVLLRIRRWKQPYFKLRWDTFELTSKRRYNVTWNCLRGIRARPRQGPPFKATQTAISVTDGTTGGSTVSRVAKTPGRRTPRSSQPIGSVHMQSGNNALLSPSRVASLSGEICAALLAALVVAESNWISAAQSFIIRYLWIHISASQLRSSRV